MPIRTRWPTLKTGLLRGYDAVTRPTQSIPKAVDQIRDRLKAKRSRKDMPEENDANLSPEEETDEDDEEAMRRKAEYPGYVFTPNSQGGTQLG